MQLLCRLQKAFNSVNHDMIWSVLESIGRCKANHHSKEYKWKCEGRSKSWNRSGRAIQTKKRGKTGRRKISKRLHNIPTTSDAKTTRISTRNKNTWAHHQQARICGWHGTNWEKLNKASGKSRHVNKNCHWIGVRS